MGLSFFEQFPLDCSDLNANYLSGNIPQEWNICKWLRMFKSKLTNKWFKWIHCRSISTNNLSGPIPTYLGKITTLKILYAFFVFFFLPST